MKMLLQEEHGVGKYEVESEGVVIEERANEMEIEDLKGKLQVMKHLGQDDAAVQKKMEEMNNELQEKIDDLQDLESTNKALIYKERQSNDELHEARKVLFQGLPGLLGNRTNIGLKRMGELDPKAFHDTCKSRFPPDEAEIQATTLCSSWQENLRIQIGIQFYILFTNLFCSINVKICHKFIYSSQICNLVSVLLFSRI